MTLIGNQEESSIVTINGETVVAEAGHERTGDYRGGDGYSGGGAGRGNSGSGCSLASVRLWNLKDGS